MTQMDHRIRPPEFIFATGIESSIPTIHHGKLRRDQMEECGHYRHWRTDFALVKQLGIRFLRYGPPLHTTFIGPGRYDWEFADATFAELRRLDIVPIVDLCHFGVPDWIGNFQNPDFPDLFAQYADAFAQRFPWIQLYTPINEMYVCAKFSALYGWWNEQLASDRGFVTALKHIVKANVLAMRSILRVRPDALFVQSESTEFYHAWEPEVVADACLMNARRFLSLDLNYGREVGADMLRYLMDNGMSADEYDFFMQHSFKQHCILGTDYYMTNEHHVHADGTTSAAGDVFGYCLIGRQYYERYRLPMLHTETNLNEALGPIPDTEWLQRQWLSVRELHDSGIPVLGFTWYSLTDQIDWDVALREKNDRVNPLGLFDLDRKIRPVGEAYRTLIDKWGGFLPAQSTCLKIPLTLPGGFGDRAGP
ncbi:family 1 glycosylhydrolase [Massilia consociata]|uniref:Family 1 glycosylhydrolase n=1 Tax=Massilia consociata TaxID=760117 RepID=A0ABV6FLU9_9BURK